MRTDDLIEALSERLAPTSPQAPIWRMAAWVAGGVVVSVALMVWRLGLRPDFMAASRTTMFWSKFAYTLALGALGLWLAERLGRPGAKVAQPARMLQSVLFGFMIVGGVKLFGTAAADRHQLLMGHSAMVCPWLILGLSIPILVGAMVALRGFAPPYPTLAGLAAGLGAGGVAAFVYAFSCDESAMPFIAVWYTLPVLAAGLIGALAGRFVLRW